MKWGESARTSLVDLCDPMQHFRGDKCQNYCALFGDGTTWNIYWGWGYRIDPAFKDLA